MDHGSRGRPEPPFSFGVGEIERASTPAALDVEPALLEVVDEDPGFDPYNSTGSFDRNDAWSRIRRR